VLVDLSLTPVDAAFELLYSNKASDAEALLQLPGRAIAKPAGAVEIREVSNAVSHGPARSVRVSLSAMELQVLATRAE
jgi:hypothetical protein